MAPPNTFNEFSRFIKKGDLVAVRKMVESGADVNVRDRFGWTPLILAAVHARTPIISYLLSVGADIRAINNGGESALAHAALHGKGRSIQVLLEAGAPVDVRPQGVSLLQFAGRGEGRFRTQKHFELLRKTGAV